MARSLAAPDQSKPDERCDDVDPHPKSTTKPGPSHDHEPPLSDQFNESDGELQVEDEGKFGIVYSCVVTKLQKNGVPEDEAFKQQQRDFHDQGTPRPRNPPPSRAIRRLQPVPLQTRLQQPYPRANVYQQNQFDGSQVSFRLPQQVFHSQEIGISKQGKPMGQPADILAQHLEYVKLIERTTRERLDKIDSILCGKIEEISAFVKNFGEKYARDAEEIDKRFRRIEHEMGRSFIGEQNHAGRLENSDRATKAIGDRLEHFSLDTIKKLTDVFNYIDVLQRRAISSEGTIQKILVRQDNLEEAFLDESMSLTTSRNDTSAILSAAKLLREELARRTNQPRNESVGAQRRVARRIEDRNGEGGPSPHMSCNVVNAHYGTPPSPRLEEKKDRHGFPLHREPHGITLLRNRWYPRWISLKDLGDFNRAVANLPPGTSFTKACIDYDIDRFFLESCETRGDMRDLYEQALHYPKPFNTLRKLEPKGRFVVTCHIRGIEFKDALCDSGSCVNVMTSGMANRIGIKELRPSEIRIGLANSTFTTPEGMIPDIDVRIGICNVPTDFHVLNTVEGMNTQLILGGPFLCTVGAIMDWPKERMCFTHIDEDFFFKAIPAMATMSNGYEDGEDSEDEKLTNLRRRRHKHACHKAESPPA